MILYGAKTSEEFKNKLKSYAQMKAKEEMRFIFKKVACLTSRIKIKIVTDCTAFKQAI